MIGLVTAFGVGLAIGALAMLGLAFWAGANKPEWFLP